MENYIQPGDTLKVTAPYALLSGEGCLVDSLFGVAAKDYAINTDAEIATRGVFAIKKTSALAISVGNKLYWDDSAKEVNKTSTGVYVGVATKAAANPSATVEMRLNGGVPDVQSDTDVRSVQVTITSAQLLALNATPIQVVAAPAAGKAIGFVRALLHKPAGTAYGGIAAGEDLSFKYTNASGAEASQVETTGFLDQAGAETRIAFPNAAAVEPVAAAALVLHLLVGEIITGTSDLLVRVDYVLVPTVLS